MDDVKGAEVMKNETMDSEKLSNEGSEGFRLPTAEEEARIIKKLDWR